MGLEHRYAIERIPRLWIIFDVPQMIAKKKHYFKVRVHTDGFELSFLYKQDVVE